MADRFVHLPESEIQSLHRFLIPKPFSKANQMPNPFHYEQRSVEKAVNDASLIRSLRAQMDLIGKTGEKLVEEHRMKCAETLLTAGITLIPCDHLLDHQFAVSRGVYEAAKKITSR